MRIALLYALFAALSILVNIGTQVAAMALYHGPWAIPLSIAAGTATGLVAKYVLDKRWIFSWVARDRRDEAQTFALYTAMGLATTAVFWGTELAFHVAFLHEGRIALQAPLDELLDTVLRAQGPAAVLDAWLAHSGAAVLRRQAIEPGQTQALVRGAESAPPVGVRVQPVTLEDLFVELT